MPQKLGIIRQVYKPGDVTCNNKIAAELTVVILFNNETAYVVPLSEIVQNPHEMKCCTQQQKQDLVSFLNNCLRQ